MSPTPTCLIDGFEVSLSKLAVQPGEVVLVKYPGTLSAEMAGRLRSTLENEFSSKGLPIPLALVIEESMDFRAVKLDPGDTVVLRYPKPLSDEGKRHLADHVRIDLARHDRPNVAVVVLDEGASAKVEKGAI